MAPSDFSSIVVMPPRMLSGTGFAPRISTPRAAWRCPRSGAPPPRSRSLTSPRSGERLGQDLLGAHPFGCLGQVYGAAGLDHTVGDDSRSQGSPRRPTWCRCRRIRRRGSARTSGADSGRWSLSLARPSEISVAHALRRSPRPSRRCPGPRYARPACHELAMDGRDSLSRDLLEADDQHRGDVRIAA